LKKNTLVINISKNWVMVTVMTIMCYKQIIACIPWWP
jgi:hypothetical protein